MDDLRIGHDLEPQVVARHHAAADELGALATVPDLGPGPGTLAMLKIFAAVLSDADGLAQVSLVTADAVRQVAHCVQDVDAQVSARFTALAP